MRRHLATVLLAATACGGIPGEAVPLLDYQVVVPPAFQARPASSSMRLAEYTVSGDDAGPAEVVVYYFGEGQGGSVDANIARWSAQFTGPDGSPVTPRIATREGTAFPTTVAEYEGAYARGVGLGPAEATPDQGLVAAVVETPRGNLFLQLVGPRAAVAAARGDFLRMVESIGPGAAGS